MNQFRSCSAWLKTYENDITKNDFPELHDQHKSSKLADKLEQAWLKELSMSKKPSLLKALAKVFGLELALTGVTMFFCQILFTLMLPIFIKLILDNYPSCDSKNGKIYMYFGGFIGVLVLWAFAFPVFNFVHSVLGMKIRVACCALVYRKILKSKSSKLQESSTGQIINLLSNDMRRFDQVCLFIHFLWIGPIEAVLYLFIIDYVFGHAALPGYAILIISFLAQVFMLKSFKKYRKQISIKTDSRIRLMNEIVCGMKIIKMSSWEQQFTKLMEHARKLELNEIFTATFLQSIFPIYKPLLVRLALFINILSCSFFKVPLTAAFVCATVIYYETIKQSLIILVPLAILTLSETRNTIERLQEFLLRDISSTNSIKIKRSLSLTKKNKIRDSFRPSLHTNIGIYAKNIKFKWNTHLPDYTLADINIVVEKQQLVAIVGGVGSGKSSLLQVLLKEVKAEGHLHVDGCLSYASQTPWIFSSNIKQNIIFNETFDIDRYCKVVQVCALESDFAMLAYGDETFVGEKGVMLSGGQKARINLARAIYKNADIYILDDPLSALDVHVSKHIFNECIAKYLKHKTVVLVTHQTEYLKNVDKMYVLKNGKLIDSGTYKELNQKHNFEVSPNRNSKSQQKVRQTFEKSILIKEPKSYTPTECRKEEAKITADKKNIRKYFQYGGFWRGILGVIVLSIVQRTIQAATDYYLTFSLQVQGDKNKELTYDYIKKYLADNFVLVLGILTGTPCILAILNLWCFTKFFMNASNNLHKTMFHNIINSGMEFFTFNSSGQILNRFSKDMGCIDEVLPRILIDAIQLPLILIGVAVFISLLNTWMIISTLVLSLFFIFYGIVFSKINKKVAAIETESQSPIFAYVSETICGLATIRTANAQNMLQRKFEDYLDCNSSPFYVNLLFQKIFATCIDMTSVVYIVTVVAFFIFAASDYVGVVGMSILGAVCFTGTTPQSIRTFIELDTQIVSLDRVIEYTELAPEPSEDKNITPSNWPSSGTIQFKSVYLQYSSGDNCILKNISFEIVNGQKVGVIGRTGAGKSSLISVLFCLFAFKGQVLIDGVNIQNISLKKLRSSIAIIPQDPVLFQGSLRKNLDPLEQYNDSEIWAVLEDVELKSIFPNLESTIEDGGGNLSLGQKQLLCLARVVLRKCKIIILDETTSNVDLSTDRLIQKTIRKRFWNNTVLTISHRLYTIMDSDQILVMDNGKILEFGEPHTLLQNKNSYLYQHVSLHEPEMVDYLMKIAISHGT